MSGLLGLTRLSCARSRPSLLQNQSLVKHLFFQELTKPEHDPRNLMAPSFDEPVFVKLFELLEPEEKTTEARYYKCRLKLLKFYAWRRCEDPESLADETISRLLRSAHGGQEIRANSIYSYTYAIATHVWQEYLRAKKKGELIITLENLPEIADSQEVDDCKNNCLGKLPEAKRLLLERYCSHDEERGDIAKDLSVSLNALRLQIFRIKQELRECLDDCRNAAPAKEIN